MASTRTRRQLEDAYDHQAWLLQVVEAKLEFFGHPKVRDQYTTLLAELNTERRRLRGQLEARLNGTAE